jgi:DNA-binding beta-propeller fold protein YncE
MMKDINNKQISRRGFLQNFSAIVAGTFILGTSGILLHNRFSRLYNKTNKKQQSTSPYKKIASFSVPGSIEAFDLQNNNFVVAIGSSILICNRWGNIINKFETHPNVRDIATCDKYIYVLFDNCIEMYSANGTLLNSIKPTDIKHDFCSIAISSGYIYATDVANKNICKFSIEGNFIKSFQSPKGFLVTNYSFDIAYSNKKIYCINPGKRKVEIFDTTGNYLGSFGASQEDGGMFHGYYNPIYIATTSTGEIISSEKGHPQIACYSEEGDYRNTLIDTDTIGGGNMAYDIKINKNKIYVANDNIISTYEYDKRNAGKTKCSDCSVNCPLREGLNI